MADDCYVGRVHNEDAHEALVNDGEFTINQDGVDRSLTPEYLEALYKKRVTGHREFRSLYYCPGGALVLFLATQYWHTRGITGKTVLGYGITQNKGYVFRADKDWDHRLRLNHVVLYQDSAGLPFLQLDDLGVTRNASRPRFYRDGTGLVHETVERLERVHGAVARGQPVRPSIHRRPDKEPVTSKRVPKPEWHSADILNALVEAPKRKKHGPSRKPQRAQPTRIDYEWRARRDRAIGSQGEDFVVAFERARLTKSGNGDLAEKVQKISETRGDAEGYDVLSCEEDGTVRYIEVKCTTCDIHHFFYLSSNEYHFAQENKGHYYLYRVFEYGPHPKLYILEDLQGANLEPTEFRYTP
jgi:hypothetical protein